MASTMKRQGSIRRRHFRVSSAYLFGGSVLVLLVGVVMLWAASKGKEQNVFFASLASALISIGVVALVTEVVLRNVYTYDLIELIEADARAWRRDSSISATSPYSIGPG